MICKDCYNHDVCGLMFKNQRICAETSCPKFKDKSRVIELPCKVGDKVYMIYHFNIGNVDEVIEGDILRIYIEKDIRIKCFLETAYYRSFKIEDIGRTVFLTREEAEKALEERKKKNERNTL